MSREEQALIPGLPDDVAAYCLLWVDYARITVLASVCRCWTKELHSADFLRRRRVAGTSQSLFAFAVQEQNFPHIPSLFSYNTSIALFDPKSDKWLRIPPVPACSQTEKEYEIVQAGHRILAIGTWNSNNGYVPTVYIYDLLARTWLLGAPSSSPHREMPACASDGVRRVFLAGGSNGCEDSRTAVIYDADDDTWQNLPDMAKTRCMCEGYFYDGVFYVIGCHSADHPTLADCGEQYDVSTGNWRTITDFPTPSYCCCDGGFMSPDGNYYKLGVEERKLMLKKDRSWSFVGNLPAEICTIDYGVRFAWKGGFVMTKHWNIHKHENNVYLLSLTGDDKHNINCKVVKMPSEYRSGLVVSGCCLEV